MSKNNNLLKAKKNVVGKENMMCYWANFKESYEEGLWVIY